MRKSNATANWKGTGKEGSGTLGTHSKSLVNIPYDYRSRFEDGALTNPEELVAAAHAGCYSMKLSFVLGAAGFTPDDISTTCTVTLDGGAVTASHLAVKAKVPGIDEAKFKECAEEAKNTCPISKLLNANISLEASLA